jgi:hypothetical protein
LCWRALDDLVICLWYATYTEIDFKRAYYFIDDPSAALEGPERQAYDPSYQTPDATPDAPATNNNKKKKSQTRAVALVPRMHANLERQSCDFYATPHYELAWRVPAYGEDKIAFYYSDCVPYTASCFGSPVDADQFSVNGITRPFWAPTTDLLQFITQGTNLDVARFASIYTLDDIKESQRINPPLERAAVVFEYGEIASAGSSSSSTSSAMIDVEPTTTLEVEVKDETRESRGLVPVPVLLEAETKSNVLHDALVFQEYGTLPGVKHTPHKSTSPASPLPATRARKSAKKQRGSAISRRRRDARRKLPVVGIDDVVDEDEDEDEDEDDDDITISYEETKDDSAPKAVTKITIGGLTTTTVNLAAATPTTKTPNSLKRPGDASLLSPAGKARRHDTKTDKQRSHRRSAVLLATTNMSL